MTTTTTDDLAGYPARSRAYWAVAMLMLAAFFSFLDRQILNLLMQPIKQDLGVTDVQLGLLSGPAFAVFFAFLAMPFGWATDRYRRTAIVAGGIATWSLATVWSGFAGSFNELLLARMLVGVGEASLMPAAYSLLADYFPPRQRGRAFGVFMMAVFVGGGGAMLFGGMVLRALGGVDVVSLPLLGAMPLWKAAFIVVGSPGLLVAALMLSVMEPLRKRPAGTADGPATTGPGLLSYMGQHRMAFVSVWACYSLLAMVSFSVTPWAAALMVRRFELPLHVIGLSLGTIQLLTGMTGAWVSGALGDRWTRKGVTGAKFRTAFIFFIGIWPALALFVLGGSAPLALAGFAAFTLVNTLSYVAASAVTQDMVPSHLRGRTTAFWYLVTGILGNGLGPFITPFVAAQVLGDERRLPLAMLLVAAPAVVAGTVLVWRGLAPYDRARAAAVE